MTSWAVVCDVWFLEPQTIQSGESVTDFASRVKVIFIFKLIIIYYQKGNDS